MPRPSRFTTRQEIRYPLYRRLSGPQGQSRWVWKILPPTGFNPQTVQLIASCYTDYTTPVHVLTSHFFIQKYSSIPQPEGQQSLYHTTLRYVTAIYVVIQQVRTQTSHESTVPKRQRCSLIALDTAGTVSISHFILSALKEGLIGSPQLGIKAFLLLSGTFAKIRSTVESARLSDQTAKAHQNTSHTHIHKQK
jgi:hypothetical protein